jgi:TonB family protein
MRSPLTQGVLRFDSNGHRLNPSSSASWLIYGGIIIEKVSLSSKMLRFEGHRVEIAVDKKRNQEGLSQLGKTIKIEITLDQPLQSVDEAQAILSRILTENSKVEDAQPELRRAGDDIPQEEIRRVQDGVTTPRAIYTPEPEFSDKARRARYQGTDVLTIVINKEGKVSRIKVRRAIGYGLDENAMETVKKWRFQPATSNNEPVAVEMNIEVSFNLY